MKKIIKPKFKDYFSISGEFSGKESLMHYEVQNFNLVTGLILFTLICLLVGINNPKLMAIPLSIISFIAIQYLLLLFAAKKISVKRIHNKSGKEGDKFSVKYRILLAGPVWVSSIVFNESFEGTDEKALQFPIIMGKHKKLQVIKEFELNEGFGEKEFGTLEVVLSDFIGIFKFKLHFVDPSTVLVFPKIQNIRELNFSNNDDTYLSGDYEIFKKGSSPNFLGLRAYRVGDPIKLINWKVSTKKQDIIINEFENAVNLRINYLIDFDELHHMGQGVNSTWEYARDLCLGLIKKNIEKNHFIKLITNSIQTEFGSGNTYFELLELKMCYLEPTESNPGFFKRSLMELEKGTALVIIMPLASKSGIKEQLIKIKEFSYKFSKIELFFIDGFETIAKIAPQQIKMDVLTGQKYSIDLVNSEASSLKNLGISVKIVKIHAPHEIMKQVRAI